MACNLDYQNRWSDDPDRSLPLSKRYAELAVEKNPKEPFARLCTSWAAIFEKDLDRAKSEAETALSCNPNYAFAYNRPRHHSDLLGTAAGSDCDDRACHASRSRAEQALSPLPRHGVSACRQIRDCGSFAQAAGLPSARTDFSRAILASALGHLGDVDEARRVWHELKEINPKYSFREHFSRQPFRQEDVERVAEGLAKAGLPN